MKLRNTILCVAFMIGIMTCVVLEACKPAPSPPPPPKAEVPPPPTPPQPSPSLADLTITSVKPKIMGGQTYIEIVVQNIGQSLASGVEGTCSYNCIGKSLSVSNQSFLQSGYLVPGHSVNGLLALSPCPDAIIRLDCTVDPNNTIPETNRLNNRWAGDVRIH
jgi:hypothetical protein